MCWWRTSTKANKNVYRKQSLRDPGLIASLISNFFDFWGVFSLPSQQFHCYKSFAIIFFFLQFQATWLPQFLFSPSSLPYNFNNLVATISFLSTTPPSSTSPDSWVANSGSKNFGNEITKIQILPSHHLSFLSHTFCQNFSNDVAEIHSFSSISQITSNSTHITNKLDFLQYSAKRLMKTSTLLTPRKKTNKKEERDKSSLFNMVGSFSQGHIHKKCNENQGLCIIFFLFIIFRFFSLTGARARTHTQTHTHIYIYMCVCVCVLLPVIIGEQFAIL